MIFYKYINKRHFDSLLTFGSVRLGTLRGYRDHQAGNMVRDSMEGSKQFSGAYPSIDKDMLKRSTSLSRIIDIDESGSLGNFSFSDCTIEDPDFFIFSMTNEYSESVHHKWRDEEGYDACYKINFPNTFFKRITQSLRTIVPVEFVGIIKVHYYDEKSGMDWFDKRESLQAYELKDYAGFSDQAEFRAVWRPISDTEIKPEVVCNESLCKYVELHSYLAECR